MTLRRAALLGPLLVLTACVHYPTIMDTGGVRLRTENGRAVQQGTDLVVTFDIASTGKYGDVIVGVTTPVAREARLVNGGGAPAGRLTIPGATTVSFTPAGPHVVLSDLARPLERGETFILTLLFEKSGGLGVVTLVK